MLGETALRDLGHSPAKWASVTFLDPVFSLTRRTVGIGHMLPAQVLAYFTEPDLNKFRKGSLLPLVSGDFYM